MSVEKLLQLMIEVSDNAASDMILKVIGGPDYVNKWLKDNGFNNISVDRSTLKMIADYSGIDNLINDWDYGKKYACVSEQKRIQARNNFYKDLKDTTTPTVMVHILADMYNNKLVTKSSVNFLQNSMLKCKWGKNCIKKFLPKNILFCHKTGRMDGVDSDIGVIELPNKKGHLAIAIYTNGPGTIKEHERAIALSAKAIFDYFSN